jgi:hypothetical protein
MSHVGDLWERLVCAAVERREQALILIDDLLSALLDMSRPHLQTVGTLIPFYERPMKSKMMIQTVVEFVCS